MDRKKRPIYTVMTAVVSALVLIAFFSTPLNARISRNLGGSIAIGYSSTHQDSTTQENVDQEYSLNWQKSIMQNLLTKSMVRYYNIGLNESRGANSWRSELQPSVELIWNEESFDLTALATRRDSKSNDRSSHLVDENGAVTFRSQMIHYPWLKVTAQQQRLYNKANLSDRDTRDRVASVGIGYSWKYSSIAYNYAHKNTLDRSQKLELKSDNHVVQFGQTRTFLDNKLRSSLSYTFTYKNETDKNLAFDPIPREIQPFLGLYTDDATPDLGGLDTIVTLVDGNSVQPALPLIDIGGNQVNRNIGIDLGYSREASLLYIYTDRPAGNSVRWDVYRSEDNTIWELVSGAGSNFSPGFSRYEISFPQVTARYLKAVNKGLNEIDTVYVTELEALQQITATGVSQRDQSMHIATLNNNLLLGTNWSASSGVSLRRDGGNELDRGRNETFYSLGLRNQLSTAVVHNARLQIGLIDFQSANVDVDKIVIANYDLQYRPLQTLDFSISLNHRDSYIASMKYQEISFAMLRMRGDILPRLKVSNEFAGGRNTLLTGNARLDSWSYRLGLDGRVTQRLSATADYFHQRVRDLADSTRIKNQYSLGFGLDVSQNISVRGNVSLINDGRTRSVTQDYSLGWLISPKLVAGASVNLSEFQNSTSSRGERYSAQVEYSLSRRTVLSGSYSENDLTSAGGGSNRSVRVGMRTGI